jgi:hypothetical protein
MSKSRPARRSTLLHPLALAASVLLGGCAFFNPYIDFPKEEPKPQRTPDDKEWAGGAGVAMAAIDDVRRQYFDGMQSVGRARAITATTGVGLTGWGVYNALKPNEPGASAPGYGDTLRTARLGAAVGTLYGLSQYLVNPAQESVYADGYRALTCLKRQALPLLMPKGEAPNAEKSAVPQTVADLDGRLKDLEAQIQTVYEAAAAANVALNEAALARQSKVDDLPSPMVKQLRSTFTALSFARNTLADGQALAQAVRQSGPNVSERAHTIVGVINAALGKKIDNLNAADTTLKSAQSITTSFIGVGQKTKTDQVDRESGGSDVPQALAPSIAPPQASVGVLASPGQHLRFAAIYPSGGTLAAGSLLAVMAAQAAMPTASATSEPTKTDTKPAAKAAAQKPKAATAASAPPALTLAEWEAISSAIKKGQDAAQQRDEAAKQAALLKPYEEKIKAFSDARPACGTAASSASPASAASAPIADACDARHLAKITEDLYAARRPVKAAVLHFRSETRIARNAPECSPDGGLRVTPDEVVLAYAGEEVAFIVAPAPNGAIGGPVAVLQGSSDGNAKLEYSTQGSPPYIARIKLGSKAEGRYTFVITDANGTSSQAIPIVVKAPRAAAAASSAASGAKSDAAAATSTGTKPTTSAAT